jgi:hypothetical protein
MGGASSLARIQGFEEPPPVPTFNKGLFDHPYASRCGADGLAPLTAAQLATPLVPCPGLTPQSKCAAPVG